MIDTSTDYPPNARWRIAGIVALALAAGLLIDWIRARSIKTLQPCNCGCTTKTRTPTP